MSNEAEVDEKKPGFLQRNFGKELEKLVAEKKFENLEKYLEINEKEMPYEHYFSDWAKEEEGILEKAEEGNNIVNTTHRSKPKENKPSAIMRKKRRIRHVHTRSRSAVTTLIYKKGSSRNRNKRVPRTLTFSPESDGVNIARKRLGKMIKQRGFDAPIIDMLGPDDEKDKRGMEKGVKNRQTITDLQPVFYHPKVAALFNFVMLAKVHSDKGRYDINRYTPFLEDLIKALMDILMFKVRKKFVGTWFWGREEVERSVFDVFLPLPFCQKMDLETEFETLSCVFTTPFLTKRQLEKMFVKFLLQRKYFIHLIKKMCTDGKYVGIVSKVFHEDSFFSGKRVKSRGDFLELLNVIEKLDFKLEFPPPLTRVEDVNFDPKRIRPERLLQQFEKATIRVIEHFTFQANTITFGVPLEMVMSRKGEKEGEVPSIVMRMTNALRKRGFGEQGLFRVSCEVNQIKRLKKKIDSGQKVDFMAVKNIHTVAALLKDYFRTLPEPVCTHDMFSKFLMTCDMINEKQKVKNLQSLFGFLPVYNQLLIKHILSFLSEMIQHSGNTMMNSKNLAIVWGVNMLRPKGAQGLGMLKFAGKINTLVNFMIENYEDIEPCFAKRLMMPPMELRRESVMISKHEKLVLRQIGDEGKNVALRTLVRDLFCKSLIILLSHGLKDSFLSITFLWDVMKNLVYANDVTFEGNISLSRIINQVDECIKLKKAKKKIENYLKVNSLFCRCLTQAILKDLVRLLFRSEDVITKFYHTHALITDRKKRTIILRNIDLVVKRYPFRMKIVKIDKRK